MANPLRFHRHNPRSYWIDGMKFTCNNYIEGAINKYYNASLPYMVPLFTYYVSDNLQEKELNKQYESRYQSLNGSIPDVAKEENEEQSSILGKDSIVPEALRIGYSVLIIPKYAKEYPEMQENALYFIKERYFDNYIIVSDEKAQDYVINCEHAIYADIINPENAWKSEVLRSLGVNVS